MTQVDANTKQDNQALDYRVIESFETNCSAWRDALEEGGIGYLSLFSPQKILSDFLSGRISAEQARLLRSQKGSSGFCKALLWAALGSVSPGSWKSHFMCKAYLSSLNAFDHEIRLISTVVAPRRIADKAPEEIRSPEFYAL